MVPPPPAPPLPPSQATRPSSPEQAAAATLPQARGLHSSTFRLNVNTLCGIGGAFRVRSGVLERFYIGA